MAGNKIQVELSPKMRGYLEGRFSMIYRSLKAISENLNENPPDLKAANKKLENLKSIVYNIEFNQYGFSIKEIEIDKKVHLYTFLDTSQGNPMDQVLRPYLYRVVNIHGNVMINGRQYATNSKFNTVLEITAEKDGTLTYTEIAHNCYQPLSNVAQAKMYRHRLLSRYRVDQRLSFWRSLWLLIRGHRVRISEITPSNPLLNQPNTTELVGNALQLAALLDQDSPVYDSKENQAENFRGKQ